MIEALREYWSGHPGYPDLGDYIQGKYAFKERPQYGMVVKVGSANKVQLSPDNYGGVQKSYVTLARIPGYRGQALEWVGEDSLAIRANGGRFPTPPGVYYGVFQTDRRFTLEPLLDVRAEPLTLAGRSEAVLQQFPFPGTLRLYEEPSSRLLRPGMDYEVGEDGATVRLLSPLPEGLSLLADYRYPGPVMGPWDVEPETAYPGILPGCVLNFGRRMEADDRFALVVTELREEAYEEYLGKWELSVDIDVIARDVHAQTELADYTAMYLWVHLRPIFAEQGIDLSDVSMSGESEEVYDENADDYYFNSSLSLSVQTEWLMFSPILHRLASYENSFRQMPPGLQLGAARDPFFTIRRTGPTLG